MVTTRRMSLGIPPLPPVRSRKSDIGLLASSSKSAKTSTSARKSSRRSSTSTFAPTSESTAVAAALADSSPHVSFEHKKRKHVTTSSRSSSSSSKGQLPPRPMASAPRRTPLKDKRNGLLGLMMMADDDDDDDDALMPVKPSEKMVTARRMSSPLLGTLRDRTNGADEERTDEKSDRYALNSISNSSRPPLRRVDDVKITTRHRRSSTSSSRHGSAHKRSRKSLSMLPRKMAPLALVTLPNSPIVPLTALENGHQNRPASACLDEEDQKSVVLNHGEPTNQKYHPNMIVAAHKDSASVLQHNSQGAQHSQPSTAATSTLDTPHDALAVDSQTDLQESNLNLEDDEDVVVMKRRKVRKSMIIPRMVHMKQAGGTKQKDPPADPQKAPVTAAQFAKEPNVTVLTELRRLVHSYTALPKEDRVESSEAKTIHEMTGYSLTSVPSHLGTTPTRNMETRQAQFAVIRGLHNELRAMDAFKTRDSQMMEQVTECRVHKVRGGALRYLCRDAFVTPQQYEQRYCTALDEMNKIRSQSWANYFRQLGPPAPTPSEEPQKEEQKACKEDDSGYHSCHSHDPDDDEAGADNMDVEDENKQKHSVALPSDTRVPTNVEDAVNEHANANTTTEEALQAAVEPDLVAPPSLTEEETLLPWPSRDSPSSDPQVAQAQAKLWQAVDHARLVYSIEMRAIQSRQGRNS